MEFQRICVEFWLISGLVLLCLTKSSLIESFHVKYDGSPQEIQEYEDSLNNYSPDSQIRRLTRANEHKSPHRNPHEEFQCIETKKALSGEGSGDIDEICHDEKKKSIFDSVKRLGCKSPILKIVKLKPPGPNFELLPSVALVPRCDGHCPGAKICKPKTVEKMRIPVFQVDQTTRERTCINYEVDKHIDCHCGCAIEASHCTEQQTFHAHHCFCSCDNHEERENCYEKSKITEMFWDDTTCKCTCKPQVCSFPMVWVPDLCKCVRFSQEDFMENMV